MWKAYKVTLMEKGRVYSLYSNSLQKFILHKFFKFSFFLNILSTYGNFDTATHMAYETNHSLAILIT